MRVEVKLYRYPNEIVEGVPTKNRVLVKTFPALLFPVSVNEQSSIFSTFGVVNYRLYPLVPVNIQINDEVEIDGRVYQVTHVSPSPTKFTTSVVYLRGDEDGG